MDWVTAVHRLRDERVPAVLVTVTSVRGHAPRRAGAKMVVTATAVHDSIGGGNLEQSAVEAARALLAGGGREPTTSQHRLTDRTAGPHGVQCCGGEVDVLLEPLPVRPAVAVFGVGHVGLELARILARHDLELHLVDSRAAQLTPQRLAPLDDARAAVHVHRAPVPEVVLGEVPAGTHVLVLTHDHAEDVAIVDMALRCGHLATIGLIGSSAKWRRFQRALADEGHSGDDLERVRTPIGAAGPTGKEPATIALAVAAELIRIIEQESIEQDSIEQKSIKQEPVPTATTAHQAGGGPVSVQPRADGPDRR